MTATLSSEHAFRFTIIARSLACQDPETGSIFWYNTVTQVSQWECPMDQAAGAAATAAAETGGGAWDGEENEAVSVYHEDDLGI